jgi:hypothetical protein
VKEDGLGSGAAKQAVSLIFSHGMRTQDGPRNREASSVYLSIANP